MQFGTATLATPTQRRLAATCAGERYDCGRHGNLTVAQIARIAGTSKTAIYKRIRSGAKGAALCELRWARQSEIRKASPPRRHVLAAAFELAARFPSRLPTVEEIQRFRPMSRKNAQTWRQAIATARASIQERHDES